MQERQTSQRQIILNYLQNTKIHPDAYTIYQKVKQILPTISMGTVYRNLQYLKNKGQIIELSGKIKRFDADTSLHHHFICTYCDNIFDIYQNIKVDTDLKNIGEVKNHTLYCYGICKNCLNKKINN